MSSADFIASACDCEQLDDALAATSIAQKELCSYCQLYCDCVVTRVPSFDKEEEFVKQKMHVVLLHQFCSSWSKQCYMSSLLNQFEFFILRIQNVTLIAKRNCQLFQPLFLWVPKVYTHFSGSLHQVSHIKLLEFCSSPPDECDWVRFVHLATCCVSFAHKFQTGWGQIFVIVTQNLDSVALELFCHNFESTFAFTVHLKDKHVPPGWYLKIQHQYIHIIFLPNNAIFFCEAYDWQKEISEWLTTTRKETPWE